MTRRTARRIGWCLLFVAVLLVHGGVTLWLDEALAGWGRGAQPGAIARMDVAFVRELAPAAPPAAAPALAAAPARPKPARAPRPAKAASAPEPALEPAPTEPVVEQAAAPPLPEPAASQPEAVVASAATAASAPPPAPTAAAASAASAVAAAVAAAPADAASAAQAFEWPPSTRLTYKLTGQYRGEVHGNARVQWIKTGSRYQVQVDVGIGPSFAPLLSRRATSEGEVGTQGLAPRRFEETIKLPFQSPRHALVQFASGQVTLANGTQREALPGLQDAASQFVQMTWLFTTQPQLLREGGSIIVPLALPRRMDHWIYDVVGRETLDTPVGPLDAFHLKPRRAEQRPRGELSAEIWFAPTLLYLPVRLRLRQDADTFVDLVIDSAPRMAAPER